MEEDRNCKFRIEVREPMMEDRGSRIEVRKNEEGGSKFEDRG
jgi:hypothetical protein